MRNLWLVAKHEYRKAVGKRSFLFGTLGIPLFFVAVMAISIAVSIGSSRSDKAVGYVDHAGVLAAGIRPPAIDGEQPLEMRAFADETAAQAALGRGEIQAYYVTPADYRQNRQVTLSYWDEPPGSAVGRDFDAFLRANLVAGLPQEVQQRLIGGTDVTLRSADGRREIGRDNFMAIVIPFLAGFFFVFTVMASAGYLLQVVTDEKENRTIEIMITTLSPEQLIGGKALGLMAVAVTQMMIWVLTIVVGLIIGARFVTWLQNVQIPWDFLLLVVLFFFPSYALIAGFMTAIGGTVTELRQGQQIAGLLNMLFVLPYFLTVLVISSPDSPILVALTLFPTTSFVTVTLRWATTTIPAWQLVVSWVMLVLSAALMVWASARIFRVGMLRYGQQMSLRAALAAVRARS